MRMILPDSILDLYGNKGKIEVLNKEFSSEFGPLRYFYTRHDPVLDSRRPCSVQPRSSQ